MKHCRIIIKEVAEYFGKSIFYLFLSLTMKLVALKFLSKLLNLAAQ